MSAAKATVIGAIITSIVALTGIFINNYYNAKLVERNLQREEEQRIAEERRRAEEEAKREEEQRIPEDLRYAERLTEDWIKARVVEDIRFVLSIASDYFFFDQYVLSGIEKIEEHYRNWWDREKIADKKLEFDNNKIESLSVSQFKKEFPRSAFHDRILSFPSKIQDTDIVVFVEVEGEGTLFFYRKFGSQLKMIGFWG